MCSSDLVLEHVGLLTVWHEAGDLLVEVGQLRGVGVDLLDCLDYILVGSLLDGGQLFPSLLKSRSEVLSSRDYGLASRGIGRIISKLLKTIKERVESIAEPGSLRLIEERLDLIHVTHIRGELDLLLGFLIDPQVQDIVADT